MVWEGPSATLVRQTMGATRPSKQRLAASGMILVFEVSRNLTHASDSPETADLKSVSGYAGGDI